MADPVTIKLKNPITFGSEVIEELTFREVEMGDLLDVEFKASGSIAMGDLMKVAGKMCGKPDGVIRKIRGSDVGQVFLLVSGALGKSLGTGDEP